MRRSARAGLTLVELLMVVVLMSIVTSMVIARFDPAVGDQLDAAARILIADLDYARGLSIAHNSKYSLVFDTAKNRYYLQHTGANAALNSLPKSPFLVDGLDGANKPIQIAEFAKLLTYGPAVRLHLARRVPSGIAASSVEFTSLGGTTSAEATEIWLACGNGNHLRYLAVTVQPVTGLGSLGTLMTSVP